LRLGGLAIAGLLWAAPAVAQDDERFQPAFTAEEDLDCAIFIGALMAESEAEMTTDNRIGLTSALTYFLGRYEAQRGLNLKQAFIDRYPAFLERNPTEVQQTCSVRMRAFSVRLQDVPATMPSSPPTTSLPAQPD